MAKQTDSTTSRNTKYQTRKNLYITSIILPLTVMNKFNSLYKTLRVLAYCLRFAKNARMPKKYRHLRKVGHLDTLEIESSLMSCVKAVQNNYFAEEIQALKSNQFPKHSSISSLHPFIDKNNILRVGGRLHNSALQDYSKHPMLLPAKHTLVNLIFLEEHLRMGHAPPQLLLSTVRQKTKL